jgi:hypothetical protein
MPACPEALRRLMRHAVQNRLASIVRAPGEYDEYW